MCLCEGVMCAYVRVCVCLCEGVMCAYVRVLCVPM